MRLSWTTEVARSREVWDGLSERDKGHVTTSARLLLGRAGVDRDASPFLAFAKGWSIAPPSDWSPIMVGLIALAEGWD